MLDGKSLSAAEVAQIADLDSREVLLAKLAGALKALPTRAAGLFQAPLSQMARLAKALEEKKPAALPHLRDRCRRSTAAEARVRRDRSTRCRGRVRRDRGSGRAAPAETTETPAEPAE